MPEFKLAARVTLSVYTTIEADTLEEAIDKSEDRECALKGVGLFEDDFWIVYEADGSAMNIEEEY